MSPPPISSRALRSVLAILATLAVAGCGGGEGGQPSASSQQVLRVALVPNQNPAKVRDQYEPLRREMERRLGMKVEFDVPTGYPAVVEAMANGKLDLGLFGGLTYVQARERAKVSPLVSDIDAETRTTKYFSTIIVPAGSPARSVSDLQGRDFAFGSVSSTSGSLYPAVMLKQAGIDFRSDLGNFNYTGGHDATAAAVASGNVDAGGLERRILRRLVKMGTVDGSKVRELKSSTPIEGYPWVVRDSLPAPLKERIAGLFLSLRDPALLKSLNAEGYARVKASDYDEIETRAREVGLLTPES